MFITLLRIFWPFLERLLAKQAAAYLQARRELRQEGEPLPAVEIGPAGEEQPVGKTEPGGLLAYDGLWYTLSGILLGSALAVAVSRIMAAGERS